MTHRASIACVLWLVASCGALRLSKPASSRPARAVVSLCDSNNPNNEAYWLQRGHRIRPRNWQAEVAKIQKQKSLTTKANVAGAQSAQQRAYIGKVMRVVEAAAKKTLGTETQVIRAGSRAKGTNVGDSDLDVYLDTRSPMTRKDQSALAGELRDSRAFKEVKKTPRSKWLLQGRVVTHKRVTGSSNKI